MLSASCPQLWPLPQHSPSWQRKSSGEQEGLESGPTCVWNLVGGGEQSQAGCWAWRGGSRAEVRLRAGLEGALRGQENRGLTRSPKPPYPIEKWEVVKQEGVGESAGTEDLTEPRAFQLREPGRQEGKAGHHPGARVGVRGAGGSDQDGMSV